MNNNNNQQQYHTASYKGNQPGHDDYLHAESNSVTSSTIGNASSAGKQTFKPSGPVQSFYKSQNSNSFQSVSGMGGNSFQSSTSVNGNSTSAATSIQSYHTANYKGDQPGHDEYLRSDDQSTQG